MAKTNSGKLVGKGKAKKGAHQGAFAKVIEALLVYRSKFPMGPIEEWSKEDRARFSPSFNGPEQAKAGKVDVQVRGRVITISGKLLEALQERAGATGLTVKDLLTTAMWHCVKEAKA